MSRTAAVSSGFKPQSAYTESEADLDGSMAEAELHRLQRQCRQLENDRKSYSEEARTVLNRQRNTIEKLRKDNEFLQEEFKLLQMQIRDEKKSGSGSKRAEYLKEEADIYQRRIRAMMQDNVNLDRKLVELDKSLNRYRANIGGQSVFDQNQAALKKQSIGLESRLDKIFVRYNVVLENNDALREQINVLRRERIAFFNACKKFERELIEKKRAMQDIIENSTSAYEQRDEAQARMIALKERNDKEQQNYLQEVKELERQLKQDKKLRDFMRVKNAERTELGANLKKRLQAQSAMKGSQELLLERLDSHKQAFDKIKEVTGCTGVHQLVEKFKQVEDQNFSLFNYVNDINNQVETLNEDINQIEEDIKRKDAQNNQVHEDYHHQIQKLERELLHNQAGADMFKKQNQKISATLFAIYKVVQSLVGTLKIQFEDVKLNANFDENSIMEALVESGATLMEQLRSIEQRTGDLLMKNVLLALPKKFTAAATAQPTENKDETGEAEKAAAEKSQQDASKDAAALAAMLQSMVQTGATSGDGVPLSELLGQGPKAPVATLAIHPPSTNDEEIEEEGEDTDARPFTRAELQEKTLRSIARKEKMSNEADEFGLTALAGQNALTKSGKQTMRRRTTVKRAE